MVTGYDVLTPVLKRYEESLGDWNLKDALHNEAVVDNLFFIEKDNQKYLRKIKNGKMLDVGCGIGTYSKIFSRKNSLFEHIKYFGCEIDTKVIDICKKFNPKGNFFVSLSSKIKTQNSYYDIVFSSGALQYSLNEWKRSIREFSRITKKFVAITRLPVTKYNKTFYVDQKIASENGSNSLYFVILNRDELEKQFLKSGLKILARDYSTEEFNIPEVDEKIISAQYLLTKI